MIQILAGGNTLETEGPSDRPRGELWLSAGDLSSVTGWRLASEGLCREEVCVPLSDSVREKLIDGDQVQASGLWEELGRPVLHDRSESIWVLGDAAEDRNRQLDSLEAPDFTLPDITGKLHSLSHYRGQKVLLVTWASW